MKITDLTKKEIEEKFDEQWNNLTKVEKEKLLIEQNAFAYMEKKNDKI